MALLKRGMPLCSEVRAAHKLSARLNRDIIVGGSSLDNPSLFLQHLQVSTIAPCLECSRAKTVCLGPSCGTALVLL
jgi:hypothetical protein